jgi:hypothetical protein
VKPWATGRKRKWRAAITHISDLLRYQLMPVRLRLCRSTLLLDQFGLQHVQLRICCLGEALDRAADEVDDLLVEHSLFPVCKLNEALIDDLQLLTAQRISEVFAPIPERMPSAVFSKHKSAGRHANRFGIDYLVSRPFFQKSVLVNSCFMSEGVAADDGLVGLGAEGDYARQKLTGGEELLCDNAGFEGIPVLSRLDCHDNFLERTVAGALPDAVDSALDLPGAGLNSGE